MAQPVSMDDIRQLSVAERLLLVEEIWDSISDEPDSWSLSPGQRDELQRRVDAHQASPNEGSSWQDVKAGLRNRP
ncbi:MAG: addiction module protein [Planctomycetota bacterium]|jgi:putative addiction module component (TIGR02574 family)